MVTPTVDAQRQQILNLNQPSSSSRIEYRHWDTIDSTHRWVQAHHSTLDPKKLTCVSASYQTKGRGTSNRSWLAAKGKSILCTYYFTLPDSRKAQAPPFLQIAALCFITTLRKRVCMGIDSSQLKFALKWPNDIMLNGKKIGGILSRMIISPHHKPLEQLAKEKHLTYKNAGLVPQSLGHSLKSADSNPVVHYSTGNLGHRPDPSYYDIDNNEQYYRFLDDDCVIDHSIAAAEIESMKKNQESVGCESELGGVSSGITRVVVPDHNLNCSLGMQSTNSLRVNDDNKRTGSPIDITSGEDLLTGPRIGMIVSVGLNINLTLSELHNLSTNQKQSETSSVPPTPSKPKSSESDTDCVNGNQSSLINDSVTKFVWPPSSLRTEIGNPMIQYDVDVIRELLTMDFNDVIMTFSKWGYAAFQPSLSKLLMYHGEKICFAPHGRENPQRAEGILKGLDDDGWIVLVDADSGRKQKYCSGELCVEGTIKLSNGYLTTETSRI